jgi:hypothetical protein
MASLLEHDMPRFIDVPGYGRWRDVAARSLPAWGGDLGPKLYPYSFTIRLVAFDDWGDPSVIGEARIEVKADDQDRATERAKLIVANLPVIFRNDADEVVPYDPSVHDLDAPWAPCFALDDEED